ncbi:glycosyl hydrolase family 95 catalytic domain-containing protein [Paenibacillus pectinilyticus]|nr:hypothetical protein [Paenibacillus pectinilyticus]
MSFEIFPKWDEMLSHCDLIWNQLPKSWGEGALTGNGLLGANIYSRSGRGISWHIGRTDVYQKVEDRGTNGKYRLPIGRLDLKTKGKIKDCSMRLNLYDAEVTCKLTTECGEIEWRTFTHAEQMVQVIEWRASEEEQELQWEWVPDEAINPRILFHSTPEGGYYPCPEPVINPHIQYEQNQRGIDVWFQALAEGGGYATGIRNVSDIGAGTIYVSVGLSDSKDTAILETVDAIHASEKQGMQLLLESHQDWWHRYYPASYLKVPDQRINAFYWMQMYVLASATRADRPALDLMGPWFEVTPWPAIWWNLNIQLSYSPIYTANRLELGESLCRLLDHAQEALINNVPASYRYDAAAIGRVSSFDCVSPVTDEHGNLLWTVFYYWEQYRYSMDDEMLREHVYPLLRRSVQYYIHLLTEGEDGRYHLPVSVSPEYAIPAANTNYDLSLLRWGCETLLASCKRLDIQDEGIERWRDVLNRLVDYPVDETGYMIGTDVPLLESHRHYSHLMMIYPLSLVHYEQEENRALIEHSLEHWLSLPELFAGFSWTGAASLYAAIGKGNRSLHYLRQLLDRELQFNTLYKEKGPCLETPLSGAASLQEMLLQSWGDTIRVFPAVPDEWPDIVFHQMRAEGAFLVSAVREQGATRFIRIRSLAGEPCNLLTDMKLPLQAALLDENANLEPKNDRIISLLETEGNYTRIELDIKKGEELVIW